MFSLYEEGKPRLKILYYRRNKAFIFGTYAGNTISFNKEYYSILLDSNTSITDL